MINNSEILVKMSNVHKSFGSNKVLQGVSLELYRGENLVVLGKSGSGKSVLIKCLVRLINYDSGSIEVLNHKIEALTEKQLDALRTKIGFLFQGSALYDSMTVEENMGFAMRHGTRANPSTFKHVGQRQVRKYSVAFSVAKRFNQGFHNAIGGRRDALKVVHHAFGLAG